MLCVGFGLHVALVIGAYLRRVAWLFCYSRKQGRRAGRACNTDRDAQDLRQDGGLILDVKIHNKTSPWRGFVVSASG